MKVKIEFEMNNSAFEDNPNEIEYVLQQVAKHIQQRVEESSIRDSNGNTVGTVEMTINKQ